MELNMWTDPQERKLLPDVLGAEGRVSNIELKFRRKSGEIGNSLTSAEVIELGGKQYMLSLLNDITERKHAEEALRQANQNLRLSYDATIEGWSNTLDLRDKETEGHTQRVTALTVELARAMGIPEADLIYVRWGALLHDIGKMGVPDHILLKSDELTDKEWEIMRQHPLHAYMLLSRIDFLHPALDIPRYHHEKWDGSGYPEGLKGEQIPLTARIFATVDVWDALTSDRPYRKAWSREKALEYVIGQSGQYFDPQVVEKFVKLVQKGK
jgi:putative nucleotidyltransferase with HDIG domain